VAHGRPLMAVHWHGTALSHVVHHRALMALERLETEWRTHGAKPAWVVLHMLHTRRWLDLLM
jgi:hypothetical protein